MSDNLEAVQQENEYMRRELDKLDNQVAQSMYASAETRTDTEPARSAYQTTQGNQPHETMMSQPCYTEGPEPTSDRRKVRIEESPGLDSYQPSRPVRTEHSNERPSSLSKNPRYH